MRTTTRRSVRQAVGWATTVATLHLTGCTSPAPRQSIDFTTAPWVEAGLAGRRLVTEHFDIWSTLHDAEFELTLPAFLEMAYSQYEAMIPLARDDDPRLNVYVLGTPADWARFVLDRHPAGVDIHALIRADGFTHGAMSACRYKNRATTLAALAHECWHQYVSTRSDTPIPAWLDEGIGCCFETIQLIDGRPRLTPQRNTIRINGLREAIRTGRLLSLEQLVNSDAATISRKFDIDLTQTYYAQVWALVTFLRHGADGRHAEAFDGLLSDIAGGKFAARVSAYKLQTTDGHNLAFGEAALRTYFGASTRALRDDYYRYLFDIAE